MSNIIQLSIGEYAAIRNEYRATMYSEIASYLTGSGSVAKYKNAVRLAVNTAFSEASDMGFVDGGGSLPTDKDTNAWLNGRVASEFANIDALFSQLAELRKDPEFDKAEASDIAMSRADGYVATLDGIYNESKVRGAGNMMLNFGGEDGHSKGFPCKTCKRLKERDNRHRASWYVKRGFIPYPGNTNFDCGTWQCKHFLYRDDGSLFTI